MDSKRRFHLDLFSRAPLRRLFLWSFFPYAIQAAVLVVCLLVVVNGWGVGAGRPLAFLSILRKTNATALIIWGLWWPCMVLAAIVFGRAWCTICPLELVANLGNRVGRRLGTAVLSIPRFLSLGFGILFLYLILQILGGVSRFTAFPPIPQ